MGWGSRRVGWRKKSRGLHIASAFFETFPKLCELLVPPFPILAGGADHGSQEVPVRMMDWLSQGRAQSKRQGKDPSVSGLVRAV